jgi:GNAT superfamily N-acetyltransferase
MPGLNIVPIHTEEDRMRFITFPWKVYVDDLYWVPPLISERKTFLNPEKNAFYEHATVQLFLATRDDDVVGTIAAFSNHYYNEFQETNLGFFGFFEVLDDPEAAALLLKTAEDWVREAGHESILGPAQFSTNDECGLLIDGFEDTPRALMTYNPPRYKDYLENAGFTKAQDLWAYSIDIHNFRENIPEKLIRVTEKSAKRRNIVVRTVDMKHFDEEIEIFKKVYNKSWERNWGFVPMTEPEFDHLAASLKPMIDSTLVVVAEVDGEPIGVGLTLPDLNLPLHKAYPNPKTPEFLTMAKFLWNWKVRGDIDWIRVVILGVLPEYRGIGVDALMYLETARAAIKRGVRWGEMSWILESNDMMNRAIQALGGEVYKTYRFYEKQV